MYLVFKKCTYIARLKKLIIQEKKLHLHLTDRYVPFILTSEKIKNFFFINKKEIEYKTFVIIFFYAELQTN